MSPLVEEPLPIDDIDVYPPLPYPRRDLSVGGRLGHFAKEWGKITQDSWVLSVVKRGYKIPFVKKPILSPSPHFFKQSASPVLEEEVQKLLQKRAVESINPEDPGFYSRIFLVPKRNRKFRLIIDLSRLNKFLNIQSFNMETVNKVRNAIYPKDWAILLDLTDAYLHVPIHVTSRKYLRFCLKGRVFQFRALPFGLATSPFVFTRLMVVIATHLRVRAIILFPYLDDWLVRNQRRLQLIKDREFTLRLISSLGLIINREKSELIPSQNFTFIGMEFITQDNIVRVPWDRVLCILDLIGWFRKQVAVTARMFLSLLGKLSASAQFVVLGRLHLRPLQMSLFTQWKPHVLPLEHKIFVTEQIKHHLGWWLDRDRFLRGVVLKQPPPVHTVFTDASCSGWGAHLEPEGLMCHGVWHQNQSHLHINILEMKAILLALKEFQLILSNSSVMIATDNSSVVVYLQKEDGTHSPTLCVEVWETLLWCQENGISLRVRHIPGKTNILADRLSRSGKPISTEWSLNQSICNSIFLMSGHPNIDLFVTRLNNRLPLFVSPIPDSKALAIDAMSMNWDGIHAYAFPPFHIIPAILTKIRMHRCKIVLITPLWPQRTWFPELLHLSIAAPIFLPVIPGFLTQKTRTGNSVLVHQNPQSLSLLAWILSNDQSQIKIFRETLQSTFLKQEDLPLERFTRQNGASLPVGVVQEKLLLARHLFQM